MAASALNTRVATVVRFATGSHHFVYEVTLLDRRRVVVRASRRGDVDAAAGAISCSRLLRPRGVPLPELLHADLTMTRQPFPFIVLERLSGDDLGQVIERLSRRELRRLAERLAGIQDAVTGLPRGRGFGFSAGYDRPYPHPNWSNVIGASLARSRSRIRAAGLVDQRSVDAVARAGEGFERYFARVAPTPFLHDITTKNVIVDDGSLSGIVDVDDLCFCDPMLLVGLIRVALLAHGHDPAYADAWLEILRPDEEQRSALDFYAALFCIDFLGELGHRFNRTTPMRGDPARLQALLKAQLRRLDAGTA